MAVTVRDAPPHSAETLAVALDTLALRHAGADSKKLEAAAWMLRWQQARIEAVRKALA